MNMCMDLSVEKYFLCFSAEKKVPVRSEKMGEFG